MIHNLDLSECPICSAIAPENLKELFQNMEYRLGTYIKGDTIARQNHKIKHLYILITGAVKTEMITENGGLLTIEVIKAPRPLASAFLFAQNNTFPVDVTATEESKIIKIPKEEVIKLFQKDANFLQRYLTYNSDITKFLSSKLEILTIKTIKGKLAHYLLEQLSTHQSTHPRSLTFIMDKNQTELSKYFGVTRPALARTLAAIQQEGAIKTQRNKITILNRTLLQNMLA